MYKYLGSPILVVTHSHTPHTGQVYTGAHVLYMPIHVSGVPRTTFRFSELQTDAQDSHIAGLVAKIYYSKMIQSKIIKISPENEPGVKSRGSWD